MSNRIFAAEFAIPDLSGGMFSYPSANKIPDNAANLIQNCYSDIEPMCAERNGFIKADLAILGGSATVRGLWKFKDNTGADWLIAYSSRTYYKKTSGTNFASFGFPASTANQPYAAINLGKIVFTNGVNMPWEFDGTNSSGIVNAPIGKYVAAWRTRFAMVNISGAQSTIRFSGDGDEGSWALGGNPTDPFSVLIGGANDGYAINCVNGSYQDSMIISRDYDTWQIVGFDQSDIQARNISSEVGCIDNGSMREFDGSNMFASHRGIEQQDATSIKLVSEPIRNITDLFVKNTVAQRYVTDTAGSDWTAGVFSASTYIDTVTFGGSIRLVFPDSFDSLRDGTLLTKNVWTKYESNSVVGSVDVAGGVLELNNSGGTLGRENLYTTNQIEDFQRGTTYHFEINSMPADSGGLSRFYFTISTGKKGDGTNPDALRNPLSIAFVSTTTNIINSNSLFFVSSAAVISGSANGSSLPALVDIYLSTNNFTLTINNILMSSGTHAGINTGPQYVAMGYLKGSAGAGTCQIDNFGIAPETVTFTSQAHSIGSAITQWNAVAINDQQNSSGTITYQFNSSNTASTGGSAWASIVNGGIPTNSTNTFAEWNAVFKTVKWDGAPQINDFTTNWQEGSSLPAMSSVIYDRRYMLSVTTTSTGSPFNDTVLVFQRNRTWMQLQGVFASSFAIWRDGLYFGDSVATGQVYQFDSGNSDNGANINTKIITKSYDYGAFHHDKVFRRLYLNYLGNLAYVGTLSLSYDLDRSGGSYLLGSSDLNDDSGQVTSKFPFPLTNPVRGREIQYTLTKSGTGDRLKLGGLLTQFDVKEEY